MIAGIGVADYCGGTGSLWFLSSLLVLASGWFGWIQPRVAVCAGFFTLGAFAYALTQWPIDPLDLRGQIGGASQPAVVRGILQDTPSVQHIERRGTLTDYMTVRLDVEEWKPQPGAWRPATGVILVGSRGVPRIGLYRGQRVEVSGFLQAPASATAPGLFDYKEYLRRQGIGFQLSCEAPLDWALAPGATTKPPLDDRFMAWAQARLQLGLPNDEASGLIQAMTLGWKTGLAGDVQSVFMQSGTLHVFAISGLHIALIAATCVQILRFVRMPRAACGWIVIPLVWGYIAATGWQASAIRSAAMTTMVVGTWALNRPGDLVNSLSAACIGVLIWQPGQLFQAGFQLSFGVVLSLAWFGGPIDARLTSWIHLRRDPFLPPELEPRWMRWANVLLRWLALALATGLAANIGSLPLTIQWFHMLSPVSLLANLIIVPLSEWVLLSNLVTMTAGALSDSIAQTANASAWGGMKLMVWLSRKAADLPHGWWYLRSPHWLWWMPYLAGLAALAQGAWRKPRWRWPLALFGTTWTVALLIAWIPNRHPSQLTAFAGSSALYWQAAGGHELMIDGTTDIQTRRTLEPWLHSRGRAQIDHWLLTQPDTAHIGKGFLVWRNLRPFEIYLPAGPTRSPEFKRLAEALLERPARVNIVSRGETVKDWIVLHPDLKATTTRISDRAVVMLHKENGVGVLNASGLSSEAQTRLAGSLGDSLHAEILISSIDDSPEPFSPAFLKAVAPQCVILTGATRPLRVKGLTDLRHALRLRKIGIWSLDQTGTVTLECTPGGLKLSAMDGREMELKSQRPASARN
ncbi:MAG TPA: ComEC/Rec2 family competence protein [Candidatus Limnocylindria bacterium]|nr:ComEC/Rec2 family competence protein [Candidatus Limnocylindria bacterium]